MVYYFIALKPFFMLPLTPTPAYSAQLDELIRDVAQRANYPNDDERALSHLRTVFRVVRNRTSFEQSLRFLEMLPVPMKAIFLNDWHIVPQAPAPIRTIDELADEVCKHEKQHLIRDRAEARRILRAIFTVLSRNTSRDAISDGLSFVSPETRAQLIKDHRERYHYSDTCIWLS